MRDFIVEEKLLMQKKKFDLMKAVCNNAARKLAVLSLAVAVGCGYIASAQTSEENAKEENAKYVFQISPDVKQELK